MVIQLRIRVHTCAARLAPMRPFPNLLDTIELSGRSGQFCMLWLGEAVL